MESCIRRIWEEDRCSRESDEEIQSRFQLAEGRNAAGADCWRAGNQVKGILSQYMNSAYLSAPSARAGSVVGGLTAGVTTWLSQRVQARAGQLDRERSRREDLLKYFIFAASKTYGDALMSNEPNLQELVALYAMVSRMRVQSSVQTVGCAEKVIRATLDTYFAPNKTVREVNELLKSG